MSRTWTDEECFKYGHILKKTDNRYASYEEFIQSAFDNGFISKKEYNKYKKNELWGK
jgi:hypothetical protein